MQLTSEYNIFHFRHTEMAEKDQYIYFDVRARGEAIRMLYAVAKKEFTNQVVTFADWPAVKEGDQ